VEGVSLATLARQQEEKEGTVRQRFNRALARLKSVF
jgi:DNA-directed RNA polymerase specialized sigma24 family protein